MNASKQDVVAMIQALMTVLAGIRRGSQKADAATLGTLNIVAACPNVRPLDIARYLAVNQSTVTRQLQKLQHAGYVKLTADPEDRRSCFVTLTAAGKKEFARLQEIGIQRFTSFVAAWPAGEVRELTRLLAKLEHSKSATNTREAQASGRSWQK